jgi:histidinol dehydrogenase
LDEAAVVSNKVAPEHLELAVEKPEELAEKITNAGAIFLGRYTPEAIGDYVAGPSHVLPTESSCRFSSGLSVHDFLRRQSIIGCSKKSFEDLAEPTIALANCEGLTAHALSVLVRNG